MNDRVAHIQAERIDLLLREVQELSTDVGTSMGKVHNNLISRYGDASIAMQKKWGIKRASVDDIILWLHYGREKINDTIGYLQQLSDELDDIEDEVNRHELNNADRK